MPRTIPLAVALARIALIASFGLAAPVAAQQPGNVLLVIADDVGVDRIAAYGEHPDAGPTPVIDALAAQGVLFRNAYAQPVCSPTRMALLTGRYGFRTGVGEGLSFPPLVGGGGSGAFSPGSQELTLAEVLGRVGCRTAVIGKWHLVEPDWSPDPFLHPILMGGFDLFAGSMAQVNGPGGFSHWNKTVATAAGAQQFQSNAYATSDNVDDALALIDRWGNQRWMLWLAFNAAHKPWHVPPASLHTLDVSADSPDALLHRAALEALDTELGRLLAGIPRDVLARTTIVFIGDNGTPKDATTPPTTPSHAKGSLYEGGINVPLIVAGHRVVQPGREVTALVHAVDLFATVIELAGAPDPGTGLDSVSLLPCLEQPGAAPQRRWVFSETFFPNGFGPYESRGRALRDERWKLIVRETGGVSSEQFFDLLADPGELDELLPELSAEQQAAYARLQAALAELEG